MKTFFEWVKDSVFPQKPQIIPNPENKPTMIRVERWNKYIKKTNDLDGGDIFFFDTWEDAKKWMNDDYYMFAAGSDMAQNMTLQQRVEFNQEHGVFYKAIMEFGSAEAHNEFGY